jgi:TetR/AcrR family transcriptional regulator, transcriptional repressor for nem operon
MTISFVNVYCMMAIILYDHRDRGNRPMRYDKAHKELTRQRIVEVASERFRRDGIAGAGVATLMSDAGLTHGGFYAYFGSKEALVRETLADAFRRTNREFISIAEADGGGLETIIRHYLSPSHRDHSHQGCAAAALAAEVVRHPDATRQFFNAELDPLIGLIEAHLPDTAPEARRRAASGIFAVMLGALQLARTQADSVLSAEMLESGIAAALILAGVPNSSPIGKSGGMAVG